MKNHESTPVQQYILLCSEAPAAVGIPRLLFDAIVDRPCFQSLGLENEPLAWLDEATWSEDILRVPINP
eukprot:3261291-Amphidinium_carterae.2